MPTLREDRASYVRRMHLDKQPTVSEHRRYFSRLFARYFFTRLRWQIDQGLLRKHLPQCIHQVADFQPDCLPTGNHSPMAVSPICHVLGEQAMSQRAVQWAPIQGFQAVTDIGINHRSNAVRSIDNLAMVTRHDLTSLFQSGKPR